MEHCHKPPPVPDSITASAPTLEIGSDGTDLAWIGGGFWLPENNNQSLSSSSSNEDRPENSIASDAPSKSKKKQKPMRQPRFAFMTKSETDHLEDGYRWRKYGQKAVKNSPFPRSYYRCTNSKCSVKKRVERSYEDPTVVITTYEGQHCHHNINTFGVFRRGDVISTTHAQLATTHHQFSPRININMPHQFYHPIDLQLPQENTFNTGVSHHHQQHHNNKEDGRCSAVLLPDSTALQPLTDDEGLLGDIVPRGIRIG